MRLTHVNVCVCVCVCATQVSKRACSQLAMKDETHMLGVPAKLLLLQRGKFFEEDFKVKMPRRITTSLWRFS